MRFAASTRSLGMFAAISILAVILAVSGASARQHHDQGATGYQRGHASSAQWHGGRSYGGHGHHNNGGAIAGGALLGGVLVASPPVIYAPPPAYNYGAPSYYVYPYPPRPIYYGR